MSFIAPMLATLLADPSRVAGRRLVAEPKLDGQRAQLHIRSGRSIHCFSRSGRELLRHAGMGWLRDLRWPVDSAVLDGEAVAGNGHEGIQSVFAARGRADGAMAFVAFDVLHVDEGDVMGEPWTHRRKRLEDLFADSTLPRVGIVPVTEDAAGLWDLWVVQGGGEGIVLKEPESRYFPGVRSPAWWKVKGKLTLEVTVTGGTGELVPWGDWGVASWLDLAYRHPRTGALIQNREAVRVPRGEDIAGRIGGRAELVCWGVMPSDMLRHPFLLRWL
jgi:ATP-dependent DNA ligase